MESVPKWNGQKRIPPLNERFFFLKKGLSVFWNAFRVFLILNGEERIPRLTERFIFLKKGLSHFRNAFSIVTT
jgi:hypothetical protein